MKTNVKKLIHYNMYLTYPQNSVKQDTMFNFIGIATKFSFVVLFLFLGVASSFGQNAACDPAFSEGMGNFNNAICLPLSNADADVNKGYLSGCTNPASCGVVESSAVVPPTIPTFACPADLATYREIPQENQTFISYWNNGLSTIGASAGFTDFPAISASRQGFINQLFCEDDPVFGLPIPGSGGNGTPLTGTGLLPANAPPITAFVNANGETNVTAEMELIQSDFWLVIPDYVTDIGFQISGAAADATRFMVGADLSNMCTVVEAFCLTGTCLEALQGVTEAYYPIGTGSTLANPECNLRTLRVRVYITDIAGGFNISPLIDVGFGFEPIATATGVTMIPATSADDNVVPTATLGPLETGFQIGTDVFDMSGNLIELACDVTLIPNSGACCEYILDPTLDLCADLATNPALASLDCDLGGISNELECLNGYDPLDASDDPPVDCDLAIAGAMDICAILAADPMNPIGAEDCDGGGVDNLTECFGPNGGTIDPVTGLLVPDAGYTPIDPLDPCDDAGAPVLGQSCAVSLGNIGTAGTPMDGTTAPFTATPNCLLVDDAEAAAYRGFMIGCSQNACPITMTPSTALAVFEPTYACPSDEITYTVPLESDDIYMQYWTNCVPTVNTLPVITAANQGFVNQLFCDFDVNGYPMAPASIGTPLAGIVSQLPRTGAVVSNMAAELDPTYACTGSNGDMELIQSDFWILVPEYITEIGFKLGGAAADASMFMIGTDITNMCTTAEWLDGASQGTEGVDETYYTVACEATTVCGGKFLRARLYTTDIAIGFNTSPELDFGAGFDRLDLAEFVNVYPATGPNDNTPPTILYDTPVAGFMDADGNIFDANEDYVANACFDSVVGDACSTLAENDINQTPQDVPVDGNVLTNDSDPTDDPQMVQSATGLDATGNPINIPLDGTPTPVYDENGVLAGTMAMMPDGSYTYDPAPGFTGEVPVDYVVVDSNGDTDTASLDIDVIPADDPTQNDPPVANDDTNTTEQDVDVAGNVIAPNDTDPDGDPLTVASALADLDGDGIVDEPLTIGTPTPIYGTDDAGNIVVAGTMTLNADGTYDFDPEPTFTGEVPVDYTITDPSGLTDDATLTITIEPDTGNDTYSNDDASTGNQGDTQAGNVLDNDNDPEGNPQTVTGGTTADGTPIVPGTPVTLPSGGTLTLNPDGSYDYLPDPNFVGTEIVEYEVCDDQTPPACEIATLYLTTLPINTIAAEEDYNNTPFDTPVPGSVATNDIDEEGDTYTYAPVGANGGMPVSEGAVVFNPDGSYVFTPAPGFVGETEFEYEVCDDGTPPLCTTTTLYLEVFPEPDVENPLVIANPDANTVSEGETGTGNVLANDLDPDAISPAVTTPLMAQTVAGVDEDGNPVADAGTLTLNPDGTYEFIPTLGFTGMVTQPYTICDAGLPATCDDTELVIDVIKPTTNNTYANDDAAITDVGVLVPGDVFANDTDGEGDVQTLTEFLVDTDGDGVGDSPSSPSVPTQVGGTDDQGNFVANAGTMTLNPDGTYEFDPAPGFVGNVNIPYTKCDDATPQACDNATLVITILDVKRDYGDAPVAYPVAYHRALTDSDGDGALDGTTDVWLGTNTSFESSQSFNATAQGDVSDDAITFGSGPGQFPTIAVPGSTYSVDIVVNSSTADLVFYGLWIDWNNDGVYDDFYNGSQATASPTTTSVTITTPAGTDPGTDVNIRLRADDDPLVVNDFEGGKTNGEVEDYQNFVILPIELTYFNVEENNCENLLSWGSASERNFKHYELQRSNDNGINFETIKVIAGRGNESVGANYNYIDAIKGVYYYRLKMVDLDDSFEYSDVVKHETKCNENTIVNIYPNPVNVGTTLNVDITSKLQAEGLLVITDAAGRKLRSLTKNLSEGANAVQIDISLLPIGTYNLEVIIGTENVSQLIVVTRY